MLGYRYSGMLGNASTLESTPVIVNGTAYAASGTLQLSIGQAFEGFHTCAIVNTTNELQCWGTNTFGNLGDGSLTNETSPENIDASHDYSMISTGTGFTCGITTSGDSTPNLLKCWGYDGSSQLGDGGTTNQKSPEIID